MKLYDLFMNIQHGTIVDLCDQDYAQIVTPLESSVVMAYAKDKEILFCEVLDITVNSNCLLIRVIID